VSRDIESGSAQDSMRGRVGGPVAWMGPDMTSQPRENQMKAVTSQFIKQLMEQLGIERDRTSGFELHAYAGELVKLIVVSRPKESPDKIIKKMRLVWEEIIEDETES
jgi:hypothetical protein